MPRILKNIRIDEVSAVTKGAGEGTRIVLMKRDDSADGNVHDSDWYKEQAAIAERQNEEHLREDREKRDSARTWRTFDEVLAENTAKSARGDEAEGLKAEPHTVDDAIADSVDRRRHDGIVFDIGDTRMKFPNERALAVWLAVQERIRKSNRKENTMTTPEQLQELREVVKANGLGAVVKKIVDDESSYGITEPELVDLISNHERKLDESPAQCFLRHYEANNEEGAVLRRAIKVAKEEATLTPIVVDGNDDNPDDAREASQALSRLVEEERARAPGMSAEQLFEVVMRKNQELTARAFRPPTPTTTYPFPR